MKLIRGGGMLLHITSLPGDEGCGTLGQEAYDFADFLHKSGLTYWQILPIGPTEKEMAYSPYASSSAFAGNPLFISLKLLEKEAWFRPKNKFQPVKNTGQASFDQVVKTKIQALQEACVSFFTQTQGENINEYNLFCAQNTAWLDDYAFFSTLSERFGTRQWASWDKNSMRAALAEKNIPTESVRLYKFIQYIFFKQWRQLKDYCEALNISLIGDIPIYISLDSADAWANPAILQLDENYTPSEVAGVPPDVFSETGQRWGNPLYLWLNKNGELNETTFLWWKNRLEHLSKLFSMIRLDHFLGFESYWSIPAEEETAVKGAWRKGPGMPFFQRIKTAIGDLPFIAEDLGVITPAVERLRDNLKMPGMKILQFAFDGNNQNPYLPHNIENPNTVLYTGTHDNNTINGWFYESHMNAETQQYIMQYTGTNHFGNMHETMIRIAYASTARLVIIPIQDILGFGEEHRMNTPGTTNKNWLWRLKHNYMRDELVKKLRHLGQLYDRIGHG